MSTAAVQQPNPGCIQRSVARDSVTAGHPRAEEWKTKTQGEDSGRIAWHHIFQSRP